MSSSTITLGEGEWGTTIGKWGNKRKGEIEGNVGVGKGRKETCRYWKRVKERRKEPEPAASNFWLDQNSKKFGPF